MLYILIPVALLIILTIFMLKPAKADHKAKQPFINRNYAHRGLYSADQSVPENSLKAFELAVQNGYGIELDLQLSNDGKVVVFHDDSLKRMCNINKKVEDCDYAELCQYPLKNSQQTIPLFTDVLQLIDGKIPLIIEFKACDNYAYLCSKAAKILDSYNGDFCVESFDYRIVRWFKKCRKNYLRGQLAMNSKKYKNQSKFKSFLIANLFTNFLAKPHFIAYDVDKSSLFVNLAEGMGAFSVVWTVKACHDRQFFEETNDCVIFEHYLPSPKYNTK